MVDLNTGRILCPVHQACIGCFTHLDPCALKEWARALQPAALAGHWAEPVLEGSAQQVAPRPTALRFGKVLGVAEPASAVVELAGQIGEQIGWMSVNVPVLVPA